MANRQSLLERRRRARRRKQMAVIGAIVGGVLVMVAAIILIQQASRPKVDTSGIIKPEPKPYYETLAHGNVLGDPDAPITIVEFSDFQCPHCQHFYRDVEPKLIEALVLPGKAKFMYRSMGKFIGEESLLAAEALYCAEEQGAFWPYHDILFLNAPQHGKDTGAYSMERLIAMAEVLGLDTKAFAQCLEEHRYRQRAEQDKLDGFTYGVQGTPTFIFLNENGEMIYRIDGAADVDAFIQAVEELTQQQP
ncbi:MAG: thioredoxin domain-containing protein [Chloroflexi bacterium]|nr:thioredoxin domain-containing protein [Chloroflexota bacterium]